MAQSLKRHKRRRTGATGSPSVSPHIKAAAQRAAAVQPYPPRPDSAEDVLLLRSLLADQPLPQKIMQWDAVAHSWNDHVAMVVAEGRETQLRLTIGKLLKEFYELLQHRMAEHNTLHPAAAADHAIAAMAAAQQQRQVQQAATAAATQPPPCTVATVATAAALPVQQVAPSAAMLPPDSAAGGGRGRGRGRGGGRGGPTNLRLCRACRLVFAAMSLLTCRVAPGDEHLTPPPCSVLCTDTLARPLFTSQTCTWQAAPTRKSGQLCLRAKRPACPSNGRWRTSSAAMPAVLLCRQCSRRHQLQRWLRRRRHRRNSSSRNRRGQ